VWCPESQQPGIFESFVCVSGHPCATDLTDNFFCFVWHEVDEVFVPWVRDNECVKREKERESEKDRRENAREEG
jgi:hypothetical protein